MGKNTGVQWCHHTFNPWWGCTKISPGCKNCYAATLDHRVGGDHWGLDAPRKLFGDRHWSQPLAWDRAAAKAGERRRVFCASMADVFEDRADLEETRQRMWRLINDTPHLDWLLLSKRPENAAKYLPWIDSYGPMSKPWPNVWLGVSVENQDAADERIPHLLATPAAVRFISAEPLLGPLDVRAYLCDDLHRIGRAPRMEIDWLIAGCESGANARPCEVDWLRSLRNQCMAADVPFFLKQAREAPYDDDREDPREVGYPPHSFTPSLIPVCMGTGSTRKPGGIIGLPYLDGVQWAKFPGDQK